MTEFSQDRNRKDGYYLYCKACVNSAGRHRWSAGTMGPCVIDGCERPRRYREPGYCAMHYKRWRKKGSPGDARSELEQRDTACSYCGSNDGKIIYDSGYPGGGLCEMHQGRWRRSRTLGPKERLTLAAPEDGQCAHVDPDGIKCSNAYLASGMCALHYQRVAHGRGPDDAGIDIRIPSDEAVRQMLDAGVRPLDPYVRSDVKWRCRCMRCRRIIESTLESIRRGHDPCWYCSGARVDPREAEAFMLKQGMRALGPWPGRVDRKWPGIHVGNKAKPGCMGEIDPTYHSVKTHGQGVCFACGERGYSVNKPGVFYVVSDEEIVKCGIANMRNFARRMRGHRAQGLELDWAVGHSDGRVAWEMERDWKIFRLEHPRLHVTKERLRDGYTEAMVTDDVVRSFIRRAQASPH